MRGPIGPAPIGLRQSPGRRDRSSIANPELGAEGALRRHQWHVALPAQVVHLRPQPAGCRRAPEPISFTSACGFGDSSAADRRPPSRARPPPSFAGGCTSCCGTSSRCAQSSPSPHRPPTPRPAPAPRVARAREPTARLIPPPALFRLGCGLQPLEPVPASRAEVEDPLKSAAGLDQDPPELRALRHKGPVVGIVCPIGRMGDLVDVRRHAGELPIDRPQRLDRRAVHLRKPPIRRAAIRKARFRLRPRPEIRASSSASSASVRRIEIVRSARNSFFAASDPAICRGSSGDLSSRGVAVRCGALAGSAGVLGWAISNVLTFAYIPAVYLTQPSHSFQPLLCSGSRHLH